MSPVKRQGGREREREEKRGRTKRAMERVREGVFRVQS
jgi:hypothetical protein